MARRVLVVDPEPMVRGLLEGLLRAEGWQAVAVESATAARIVVKENPPDLLITDLVLADGSGLDLLAATRQAVPTSLGIVLTSRASFESAVSALRAGAFDLLTKPVLTDELRALLGKAAAELDRRAGALADSVDESPNTAGAPRKHETRRLIGRCARMLALHDLVRTVAGSSSTVLIRGESGTGKELVARALHDLSPRARGPLVPVNCGAIPEDLLESELFGHVRGAFTGAVADRPGRFVLADGGTIFLDEIGDMSPKLQVKVLRVLQEQELEPVGGTQTVRVGVRVVAATNVDLEMAIELRRFREDLYYRLNVIPIDVPPLRERLEDLPLLIRHFLKIFNKRQPRQTEGFSPEAMALLARHHWPGNVRELENLVERMTILARGSIVMPDDLPTKFRYPATVAAPVQVAFPTPPPQATAFPARPAATSPAGAAASTEDRAPRPFPSLPSAPPVTQVFTMPPATPAATARVQPLDRAADTPLAAHDVSQDSATSKVLGPSVAADGLHGPTALSATRTQLPTSYPATFAADSAASSFATLSADEGVSVEERLSMGFGGRPQAGETDGDGLGAEAPLPSAPESPTLAGLVDGYERAIITEALRQHGGVKSRAAKVLGIKRTTLVERMKKLKL